MPITEIHAGDFLIAEPFLKDHSFSRAVVLLCESDENGALGFILNKRLSYKLEELLPGMNGYDFPILYGGPVRVDILHFLHCLPDKISGSIPLRDEICWGGDFDLMLETIRNGEANFGNLRLFLGQSGWSNNQLQTEMQENTWLTVPAQKKITFNIRTETLWQEAVKLMGKRYAEIIHYPIDPSLN